MMKFIIGKNEAEKEVLLSQGFSFFKEDDGEYWFLFDGKISFSDISYEIRDRINI